MSKRRLSITEIRKQKENDLERDNLDLNDSNETTEDSQSVFSSEAQIETQVSQTSNAKIDDQEPIREEDDSKLSGFISNPNENSEPSLIEYLEVAYRNKWIILAFTILGLVGAYVYHSRQIPVYKTSTRILIQEDSIELKVINNKPIVKNSMDIATWVEIVYSSDVAKLVAENLNGRVSQRAARGMIRCSSSSTNESILVISSTSLDPVLATDVANSYFTALKDYDSYVRRKNLTKTIDYLETQIRAKTDDLDSLNVLTKSLYSRNDFRNYGENLDDNLKRLNSFKGTLTSIEVDLEAEESNIKVLSNKLNEEDSTYVTETTYSEPLKIKLMNLEVELARALTIYGENHPKVIGLKKNITNVRTLISEGVEESIQMRSVGQNPLKQQILKKLVESQTKAISLKQKRNALRKIIDDMELSPEENSILKSKQREQNALILTITNLQNQLNNVRLSANVDLNRIVQLEEATVPKNHLGGKLFMALLNGFAFGLALSVALVFLLTRFDNKISSIKKLLQVYPNIPVIGTIPKFKFNPLKLDAQTAKKTDDEVHNQELVRSVFNEIALNFRYLILNKRNNAIAVVSSLKGEGKSTITNYLAIALANNNTKTLLVDADFYNPQISRYYKQTKAFGFSEVLTEQMAIHEVIQKTRIDNLMILPTGKCPPSVAHLYHSERFKDIINDLKTVCDIIIIDTPAAMYFPETSVLVNEMDCVLLTSKMGFTTSISCKKLLKKIQILDTKIGGVIANSMLKEVFDKTYQDYYHYSYYYYSKQYGPQSDKSSFFNKYNPLKILSIVKNRSKVERTFLLEDEILENEVHSETHFGRVRKKKGFELYLHKLKVFIGLDDELDMDE